MRFSLNLVEIYNNMANEYGEPLEDFISYEEFVELVKKHGFGIMVTKLGDYIYIELDED